MPGHDAAPVAPHWSIAPRERAGLRRGLARGEGASLRGCSALRRPGVLAGLAGLLAAGTVAFGGGAALAGDNLSATASLTWSALDASATDLTSPGASTLLYVRLTGAGSFKGAEINLTWAPANGNEGTCFAHLGTQFRTSPDCTFLNRGIALPVIVADDPGHLDVAWSNTLTRTDCAEGGNAVALEFAFDGCPALPGCFTLVSMSLIDEQNAQTPVAITGARATVFGGACDTQLPPRLEAIPPQTVHVADLLSVLPQASDPEGEVLTFSGTNAPPGSILNPVTGELRFTPVAGQQGDYAQVTLTATDPAGLMGAASFDIAVPNRAPLVAAIPTQDVEVGTTLVLPIVATDADGDSLTYGASGLPTGAVLSPEGTITWSPPIEGTVLGVTLVALTIGDPFGGVATTTVALVAQDTPPTFYSIPDTTIAEGQTFEWEVRASDPTPGDSLAFVLRSGPTGMTLSGADLLWTPTHTQSGQQGATLRVTDLFGATSDYTFYVTVTNVPHARYVDQSSPCGSGCDGETWATAIHDPAIAWSAAGDSVLVAEGTYSSYLLTVGANVLFQGGYAAGGGERNVRRYPTLLRATSTLSTSFLSLSGSGAVLDGVTITGLRKAPGVVEVDSANCVLRDVTLTENTLAAGASALLIRGAARGTVLERVAIVRNRLHNARGAVYIGNGATVVMDDCTLAADSTTAPQGTPGIACDGALTARNSIIWGLTPSALPVILFGPGGTAALAFCDIGGSAGRNGNLDADPLFCDGPRGDFALRPGSPCIGAGHDGTTIGAFDDGCGFAPARAAAEREANFEANFEANREADIDVNRADAPTSNGSPPPTPHHGLLPGSLTRATTHLPVAFGLREPATVVLDIFTATGTHVRRLAHRRFPSGHHVVVWNADDDALRRVAAGMYILRFATESLIDTRRVLIVP